MYTSTQHASGIAKQWFAKEPLFFDTETTRFDGEIVDLALVDHTGKVLLSTLVKAREPISEEAGAVHHLTDAMLADAPTFKDVWQHFKSLTAQKLVVIYNKKFDLRMLQLSSKFHPEIEREVTAWTTESFDYYLKPTKFDHRALFGCAMELYAEFVGTPRERSGRYKWWKLEDAARQCGIALEHQEHRAASDAELCRRVVEWMARA